MELTNEQIDAIAGKYHGMPIRRIVRECMAVAAEPDKQGRVGQYFISPEGHFFGPVTITQNDSHYDANGISLSEHSILGGATLEANLDGWKRVPPPPADAPDDLAGWECRKPVKDEKWYDGDDLMVPGWPHDHPDFGPRRWIPPQAAKPVFLDESAECPACGGSLHIGEDDDGRETNDVSCDECGQIWPLVTVNAAAIKEPRPQPTEHTCATCGYPASAGDAAGCCECRGHGGDVDNWEPKAEKPQPAERTCDTCRFEGLPDADPKCEQCFYPELHNWEPMPAKPVFPRGPFEVCVQGPRGPHYCVARKAGPTICRECTEITANAIAQALDGYLKCIAAMKEEAAVHPAIYYSNCSKAGKVRREARDALIKAADGWDIGQK